MSENQTVPVTPRSRDSIEGWFPTCCLRWNGTVLEQRWDRITEIVGAGITAVFEWRQVEQLGGR